MKPEQLVTTIETSKRLKELGVKQESYWNWKKNVSNDRCFISDHKTSTGFSAFTAEEIRELLLAYFYNNQGWYLWTQKLETGLWESGYGDINNFEVNYLNKHKSLVEAMALTFIELKEKGII